MAEQTRHELSTHHSGTEFIECAGEERGVRVSREIRRNIESI